MRRTGGIQYQMEKTYYAYILASQRNGTLYTGITSDLIGRVYQHKNDLIEGFTKKYRVHRLVYFEQHLDVQAAIHREKRIKEWPRKWKLALIEAQNLQWKDLYSEVTGSRGQAAG
jgi:putative endonuclease